MCDAELRPAAEEPHIMVMPGTARTWTRDKV